MPDLDKDRWMSTAVVLGACAALVTLAVYLPALKNGFVNWDDNLYVYENLRIRSIDLGFLKWILTEVIIRNWHPLTMLSHAVDYALWGLNPMGHHLTSIIGHGLNTFLVALLCFRLATRAHTPLKRLGPGALATGVAAALLFGLHPLHVESVAWVSERKDVLSALFFLLSLLAYLKYTSGVSGGSGRRFNYAASLVLFALALMSKPMAISLPIVLLILDYYPLERLLFKDGRDGWARWGRVLLEKLPFFALSGASAVVTLWAQHGVIQPLEAVAFTERVAVAVRGYAFYLYKMLLPVRLAPIYPLPWEGELFNLWFFASIALLVAITAFCIYMAVYPAKKRRVFLAAWLYYLVMLLPVIGLVQVGRQAAADRYTYLPSLGLFMLAGLGAGLLFEKWIRARTVVIAVMVMVSALMAYTTVRQTGVWKDSITFWSYQINIYPDRVPIAHANRGAALYDLGDFRRAMEDFDTAIALKPEYAKSYINRGKTLQKLGDFRRAIEDFDTAIALSPEYAQAYVGRGLAYAKSRSRRIPRAIEDFTKALEIDPGLKKTYYDRAIAYSILGRHTQAIKDLTVAIEIDPGYADAYHNRGVAYANRGKYKLAIEDFSRAISIDPEDADSYRSRGHAYMRLGYTEQATEDYKTADRLR